MSPSGSPPARAHHRSIGTGPRRGPPSSTARRRPTSPTPPTSPCRAPSTRSTGSAASPSTPASSTSCCSPAEARTKRSRPSRSSATSGARWTIVRASWFAQNFSEGQLLEATRSGTIAMPAGDVAEPFVDVEDIADVADRRAGRLGTRRSRLRGHRAATARPSLTRHANSPPRPDDRSPTSTCRRPSSSPGRSPTACRSSWPAGSRHCAETVLDGRNENLGHGVQEALGRAPRDFRDFAARAAAEGAWTVTPATQGAR